MDRADWHSLVEENQDLAPKCVSLYCRGRQWYYTVDDLVAEGNLVLCRVAQNGGYATLWEFRNLAVACIKNRLLDLMKGLKCRLQIVSSTKFATEALRHRTLLSYEKRLYRERTVQQRVWEVEEKLTEEELGTVELVASGLTHHEAAIVLSQTHYQISNRIVGIRRRLGLYGDFHRVGNQNPERTVPQ